MTLQLLTIAMAAGGMLLIALTHNSVPVYFMFCALLAVLLVSYVISRLSRRALAWRRHVADRVFEDELFAVRVELANRGRLPRFMFRVTQTFPPFLECDERPHLLFPALWPGERAAVSYQVRARKRGVYPLGPLTVSISDPFGIFPRDRAVEASGEAVIYPRPVPLQGDLGRTGLDVRGLAAGERARASEPGLDFYGIRDYSPGDELRRIHWPATAHHGRLTVIEFERGASENLAVVLDNGAGTEYGSGLETTLEVGVRAAASFLHWALSNDGIASLAVDSPAGPRWLAVETVSREHEMLELLARVQADGSMPASALVAWAAQRLASGASLCLLTAAPDAGLPAVVEALIRRQVRAAMVVLDAHSFDASAEYSGQMIARLASLGATTLAVRRGDDLAEALGRVLIAGE